MRFALASLFCMVCLGQDILDESHFPDANFRECLIEQFSKLTESDALEVESLDCSGRQIADLTGIHWFANLRSLYCQDNQITSLSPLASLFLLERLYAWRNALTQFDELSELTNLRVLLMCCNEITSLPHLGHLVALETLVIHDNQLTHLPGLPKPLKSLQFGGNPLEVFPDLSRLNLEELSVANLGLWEMPDLSNHKDLRVLSVENNELTDLGDLSGFPLLESLNCWGNPLSTLPDLSALTSLRYLHACCCEFTQLPDLSHLKELRHLYVYNNQLTEIPSLAGLNALERVLVADNFLDDLAPILANTFVGTRAEHQIHITDNALTSDNCFQVQTLANRCAESGADFRYVQQRAGDLDCQSRSWITHVTRAGGGFETWLFFKNFSSQPAQIEILPYRADGSDLAPIAVNLEAGEFLSMGATELFGDQGISHFSFWGSLDAKVSAGYRLSQGDAVTAHVNAARAAAGEYWLIPGEWDLVFDGLALVNLGDENARITAEWVDATGEVQQSCTLASGLTSHAKILAVFDDLFEVSGAGMVRITCTQDCIALFLRGTGPGIEPGVLFEVTPFATGQH